MENHHVCQNCGHKVLCSNQTSKPKSKQGQSGSVRKYKVVVMGSGGIGKSCFCMKYLQDLFLDNYDPTIENVYNKDVEIEGDFYHLEVLDTAGQDESSHNIYFKQGQIFILMYSITSKDSFNNTKKIYEQLMRVPIVFVGNKTDLEDQRAISSQDGLLLAEETSAKTGSNLGPVFQAGIQMANKIYPAPKIETKDSFCLIV